MNFLFNKANCQINFANVGYKRQTFH